MRRVLLIALILAAASQAGKAGIFLENCRNGTVYSEDFVIYLQEALIADGVYKGAADGKIGPTTKAAFAAHREKHGLPQKEGIDLLLLKSLLKDDYSKIADRDFRLAECSRLFEGSSR